MTSYAFNSYMMYCLGNEFILQIPLRRSRLSGTVRATNPDKREPLTFET
ncbi:hypothetical protein [uncultured Methanobrevibacter sp.]|nr:hypothetical protein [uncultured Methanobrevibacter sp.]